MMKLKNRHTAELCTNSKRFAKIISIIFNPLTVPLYVFIALLFGTYISVLTLSYRLLILAIVFSFTFLVPLLTQLVLNLFSLNRVEHRAHLMYNLFLLISNIFCWLLLLRLSTPWYMSGIILSNFSAYLIALLLNLKWQVSLHSIAIGTVVGNIIVLELFFDYNPLFLLSFFIFVSGLVTSSRMELKGYSLKVVLLSFLLGLFTVLMVLHPSANFLFRFLF